MRYQWVTKYLMNLFGKRINRSCLALRGRVLTNYTNAPNIQLRINNKKQKKELTNGIYPDLSGPMRRCFKYLN
jgi:hypothetical protein